MILNKQNGERSSAPPASGAGLREPGPVWCKPRPRCVHANGGPVPAVLVRLCDFGAWIVLLPMARGDSGNGHSGGRANAYMDVRPRHGRNDGGAFEK